MQTIIRQMLIAIGLLVVVAVIVQVVSNVPAVQKLTPTTTPSPTNVEPGRTGPTGTPIGLDVHAQRLNGNTIIIASVSASVPGWVSIHPDASNSPTVDILGYAPVPKGVTTNLAVHLTNVSKLAPLEWAILHVDKGQIGVFEYPGADGLVYTSGNNYVRVQFTVSK